MYGNKKKKPLKTSSPAADSRPRSPAHIPEPDTQETPKVEVVDDVKSDWENSADEQKSISGTQPESQSEVKDTWDASSDEEKEASASKHTADAGPSEKGIHLYLFNHH